MHNFVKLAWRNMWRNWRRTAIALVAIVLGLILLLFFDGIITSDEGSFPVTVTGLEPNVEAPVSIQAENISYGRFLADDEGDGIVIGQGLAGIVVGVVLGSLGVVYLSTVWIPLDAAASVGGSNIALGSTMYAHYAPTTFMWLSVWTLVFVLLASLYPARFAARQEPVEALRAV